MDLTDEDVASIRTLVPEAEIVCPRAQLGGFRRGNNVVRGTRSGGFSVMGDIPEFATIQSIPIVSGRFGNRFDLDERRKIAVIGPRVQELLFEKGEDPLGKEIRVQGVTFTVVGTFGSMRSGNRGDEDAQTLYVPFTTFQQAFHRGNQVDWLAIKSRDDVPATVGLLENGRGMNLAVGTRRQRATAAQRGASPCERDYLRVNARASGFASYASGSARTTGSES